MKQREIVTNPMNLSVWMRGGSFHDNPGDLILKKLICEV